MEKTVSLTSGAEKTGQPRVKEGNQNTFYHNTQATYAAQFQKNK